MAAYTLSNSFRILILIFMSGPVFLTIWILNISLEGELFSTVSPMRWLISILISVAMSSWGVQRRSLNNSGALTAVIIGFILTIANYCFAADLLMFFISASRVTKFRAHKKRKLEAEYKEGGQRNWVQVLSNSAPAVQMSLLYLVENGCGETEVDFARSYNSSWLTMAVLGAVACCNGDTWSSEVGSVVGSGKPRLIHTWRKVPTGTNGGVSLAGTLGALVGGTLVGLAHYLATLTTLHHHRLIDSPPQWPVILVGGAAGLLGSMVDSFLGATMQYSGYSKRRACVVERCDEGEEGDVEYISGRAILDNHSVNMLSSQILALCTPRMAMYIWSYVV